MREIYIPKKVEEAFSLLSEGVLLQGGTELLRLGGSSEKNLIDLKLVASKDIVEEGDVVKIGSGVTFQEALENPLVPTYLKSALSNMASLQLRGQATLTGNVAALRDDSYLIPALRASLSEMEIFTSEGVGRMSVRDYVDKKPSGVILSLFVKKAEVYVRSFRLTSHSHAIVTGAVSSEAEAYAVKGSGIFTDPEKIDYTSDMYGSSEYKKYLVELIRKEGGR